MIQGSVPECVTTDREQPRRSAAGYPVSGPVFELRPSKKAKQKVCLGSCDVRFGRRKLIAGYSSLEYDAV
jgi:hypothetical protein